MKLIKKYMFANKKTGQVEICTLEQAIKMIDDLDMTKAQHEEMLRIWEAKNPHFKKPISTIPEETNKVKTRGRKRKEEKATGGEKLERAKRPKSTRKTKSVKKTRKSKV